MDFLEFEYPLLIRERHLDTFGHVNNATYLEIFEEARWDLITKNGFGLREIRERGIGPVILEARVRFQREVTNLESVVIRSRCVEYKGMVGRMEQVMVRADSRPAAKAEFTFGLFDLRSRKLIEPTADWLKAIGAVALTDRPA